MHVQRNSPLALIPVEIQHRSLLKAKQLVWCIEVRPYVKLCGICDVERKTTNRAGLRHGDDLARCRFISPDKQIQPVFPGLCRIERKRVCLVVEVRDPRKPEILSSTVGILLRLHDRRAAAQ